MSHANRSRDARGSCTDPTFTKPEEASNDDLRRLGLEYVALQLQLNAFIETQHQLWPDQVWTEQHEMRCSSWIEPIRDRMVEIRWEAVKLKATDLVGLRAKATILHDIVDNDPDDVRSQLTTSLCEDLISFSDATHSEHLDGGVGPRSRGQTETSTTN